MNGRLLSLGSVNVEMEVRVERWAEPEERALPSGFASFAGGKGTRVALVARKFGADVALLARVGEDALADVALIPLREHGVHLDGVLRTARAPTGIAVTRVHPSGGRQTTLALNANDDFSDADAAAIAAAVRDAPDGSVLVADLEVSHNAVEAALRTARARPFAVVLDAAPADRMNDALLALADVVIADALDAAELTGVDVDNIDAAHAAARRITERGARAAVVRVGAAGSVLVAPNSELHVPALRAGGAANAEHDAFVGAAGVALLERCSLSEAVVFATAASSLVTDRGQRPASYPGRADVERRVAEAFGLRSAQR